MGEQDNHEDNALNELSCSAILLVLAKRKTTLKVFSIAMLINGSHLLYEESRLRPKLGTKGDKGLR